MRPDGDGDGDGERERERERERELTQRGQPDYHEFRPRI